MSRSAIKESVVLTGWRKPHTAAATIRYLDELLGGNVYKKSVSSWSAHSPILSSLDFFLWGYCKDDVCHTNPQSVIELQWSDEDFIANVSRGMGKRVMEKFKRRLTEGISRREYHIEDRI